MMVKCKDKCRILVKIVKIPVFLEHSVPSNFEFHPSKFEIQNKKISVVDFDPGRGYLGWLIRVESHLI